jgi:hypothetical protein
MEMRVATFALSDQMITAALRTQSIMANEQIQSRLRILPATARTLRVSSICKSR